jgi:hypothetical protein
MSTAYSIGVSIVLANGVSPVLAIIGRDLFGLKTSIAAIENNFSGWTTALAGFGAVLTGATVLGAMAKLVNSTKEYQDELIKIQRLGGAMGAMAGNGQLSKQAFDMAQRVPMKVEDLLKIPGDLTSILGPEHALEVWEPLARYSWVAKRNNGDHGGGSTNDLRDLIRGGEMSGRIYGADGQIDPKKLEQFIDDVTKATAATHGMVNPQTILGMAQQGGPALRGLSEDGFLTMLVQAQAMGGHRAGTAYLSLWQQLAGGTMLKRTAQGMQDFGLLKPDEWSSEGGHVSITKEASKRLLELISKDPLTFAGKINEKLRDQGITDPAEQMQAVMRITGRQTTQRFTAEEVVAYQQMKAEVERMKQGLSVDASKGLYDAKSISGAESAMGAAWHNLVIAMGGPEGEHFASFLNKITGAINGVTAAVNKLSPEQIDTIFQVVAGIGAGLIVLGGILTTALVTTMVGAPVLIGAAVPAIVAAVGAFVAIKWDAITGMFNSIAAAISSFIDAIAALYHRITNFTSPGKPGLLGIDPGGSGASPDKPDILGIDPGGRGTSPGKTGKPWHPVSFNPGTEMPRAQSASFSLNVDGRALAQSVIDHLESIYGMPSGAAAADGVHSPFADQYTNA